MTKLLELLMADCDYRVQKELREERFELRPPLIQMKHPGAFLVWIADPEETVWTKDFTAQEIDDIVAGRESYGDRVDELLREWYPGSKYQCLKEITALKRVRWNSKNPNKKMQLRLRQAEWESRVDSPEVLKHDLQFAYQETGERLEKLYKIFYGDQIEAEFRMGLFTVGVDIRNYQSNMLDRGYGGSRGFFADFANAYDFIRSLDGSLVMSISTGRIATDVSARARGEEIAQIRSIYSETGNYHHVTLQGSVLRDEPKGQRLQSSIDIHPLHFTVEEFSTAMLIHYPDAVVMRRGRYLSRFNVQGLRGDFQEREHALTLKAAPDVLAERALPFLETIIPNQ